MTSKERVRAAFNFEHHDRVPVNYRYNDGIDAKLKKHFGLGARDDEGLRKALGVDFRMVEPVYTGPKLYNDIPGRRIDPIYGHHMKWVEHETGGYWEYCDYFLENTSVEDIENFKLPDPDDFDYDGLIDQCDEYRDYGIIAGNNGIGVVICRSSFYRGMEQALVDLITDDEAGMRLIDRILDFQLGQMERIFDKIGDRVDVMWMGEDLGTQIGPLIGMDTFRSMLLPRHKKFIDLASMHGIPAMLHTCGSSSWSYEDYIACGLRAVETLQPEAANMSPRYLMEHFSGRLVFHGCISTAGALTYGSAADV